MKESLFSKNILFLRKKKGWTQSEMPDRCKFSQSRWSSWENDKAEPDISNLIVISDLFGVPIDWLIRVDLEKNVYLIENLDKKNIDENVYLNVYPNVLSAASESETTYKNAKKEEVDLLILRQLNAIADDVKDIKRKLP